MKKVFILAFILLCLPYITVNSKVKSNELIAVYTKDKSIPAYLESIYSIQQLKVEENQSQKNEKLATLLSLDERTHPVLSDTLTDRHGGFHETYKEYYNDIEVEGSKCVIHYNHQGVATDITGNFKTVRQLSTNPIISEEAALKAALDYIGAEVYIWDTIVPKTVSNKAINNYCQKTIPTGKLVVYVKEGIAYLSYKFVIEAVSPRLFINIFVDANNGKVIDEYSARNTSTALVQTVYSGQQQIETQYLSGTYVLKDYTRGSGIETYKVYVSSGYQPMVYDNYTSPDNSWTNLSNRDRAALDVHWGVEKTYDFYYTKFGRNSYDNQGAKIISFIDSTYYNASWGNSYMLFGSLDYSQNFLVSVDVVAHELTHAVTEATSQLIYSGESGAINEGLSDVFAACVENYTKPNNGSNIWIMGEDITTGGIRSMSNPICKKYHGTGWVDTSNPTWYNDYGGVHTNSGVFNYWFYILVNGINGFDEFGNPLHVSGIGLDKACQLCYLMNASYLFSDATFIDAWRCSCLAARQLGYSEFEIQQINNAWAYVGVAWIITGPSVSCNNDTYSIPDLPTGYGVTWSIDNTDFSITSSGNQCGITYTPSLQLYEVANLTAVITWNGLELATVSKRIVMHSPFMYVQGYQPELDSENGYCPERFFTIPEEEEELRQRTLTSQSVRKFDAQTEVSLPIHFTEEFLDPLIPPEYGITDIYGGNNVTLSSSRFDGMDISFSGSHAPVYYDKDTTNVRFQMPGSPENYYVVMNAEGGDGCHDFSLTFRVIPMYGQSSGEPEIILSFSGSTIYIYFVGDPGNDGIGYPWDVSIYPFPIVSYNNPVYHAVIPSNQTSTMVNLNNWSSGIYVIRIVQNGLIYTKKFAI